MKLLDKLQINLAKAVERKLEVDEGRKLAERVDTLRQLSATEVANLESFRVASLAQVKAEIDEELKKKNALTADIEQLKKERYIIVQPVDLRVEELANKEKELDEREKGIEALKDAAIASKIQADDVIYLGKATLREIKGREEEAERTHKEAVLLKKDASAANRDAQKVLAKAKEDARQILEDVDKREANVAVREREISLEKTSFARVQESLNVRERGIIDREETLERELKRISIKS